jgi:hypothetical protein
VNILVLASILFPGIILLITHLQLHPVNSQVIDRCLGRNEVFFDYDYFPLNDQRFGLCPLAIPINSIYGVICYFSAGTFLLISSNLCEIFLLGRAMFAIKARTESVSDMLSADTITKRRRYIH